MFPMMAGIIEMLDLDFGHTTEWIWLKSLKYDMDLQRYWKKLCINMIITCFYVLYRCTSSPWTIICINNYILFTVCFTGIYLHLQYAFSKSKNYIKSYVLHLINIYRAQVSVYGCVWMRMGALTYSNDKTR